MRVVVRVQVEAHVLVFYPTTGVEVVKDLRDDVTVAKVASKHEARVDKVKRRVVHPRLFNVLADEGHVGHAGGNVGLDEAQVRANDSGVWVAASEFDGPDACGVEVRVVVIRR